MKYIYREPNGKTLEDMDGPREENRLAIMSECVKSSQTVLTVRIGKHTSGPFQGLYTLEKMAKGKWVPVKDGDLLSQVMEDIHKEVSALVNGNPNSK
jgi:hypothetical protein